jgi:hypothetical protein
VHAGVDSPDNAFLLDLLDLLDNARYLLDPRHEKVGVLLAQGIRRKTDVMTWVGRPIFTATSAIISPRRSSETKTL